MAKRLAGGRPVRAAPKKGGKLTDPVPELSAPAQEAFELSSDDEGEELADGGAAEDQPAFPDSDDDSEEEEEEEEEEDDDEAAAEAGEEGSGAEEEEGATDEDGSEDGSEELEDLVEALSGSEDESDSDEEGDSDGGSEGEEATPSGQSGGLRGAERPVESLWDAIDDPDNSDSSEDEGDVNTVGDVPLEWYKHEDHIGYDKDGGKIMRKSRKDRLDQLLERNDSAAALRTIYDEYNDKEIVLSKDEIRMLMRIRKGQMPHLEVDPYQPYDDWFTRHKQIGPVINQPEPKRRFMPSKWEEKKVVKLVRAMRRGWIKPRDQRQPEPEKYYMLWNDDDGAVDKTGAGLAYVPAPKPRLPGHEESYNPPAEYIPTEEEKNAYALMDPVDRPSVVPQKFDSLRAVPTWDGFITERFERCLDLYLCPRAQKTRLRIDPESLVPKLPKPADLRPFPNAHCMDYVGHAGAVRAVAPDPTGQWLLSGGDDGILRCWEVRTGRCVKSWDLDGRVNCVAWCPKYRIASAAVGKKVLLLPTGLGTAEEREGAAEALSSGAAEEAVADDEAPLTEWAEGEAAAGSLELRLQFPVKHLAWHGGGDYLATVAPSGATRSVVVHQLSRRRSQNPFRKNKGRVVRALFHPNKPFLFVATQHHVRVYNLAAQSLAKRLVGSSGQITTMAIHASGDHVIVGSDDRRVLWFDLDLSTKPYKTMVYHTQPVRGVAFHPRAPLFASAADDGALHVFHGRVYADLMSNPLIVPVKILRGHDVVDHAGVLDCAFHPTQPWVFTAGGDATVKLYFNQ